MFHTSIAYLASLLEYQIGITNWTSPNWAPDMPPFPNLKSAPLSLWWQFHFFNSLAPKPWSHWFILFLITSTNVTGSAFKVCSESNHSSPLLLLPPWVSLPLLLLDACNNSLLTGLPVFTLALFQSVFHRAARLILLKHVIPLLITLAMSSQLTQNKSRCPVHNLPYDLAPCYFYAQLLSGLLSY